MVHLIIAVMSIALLSIMAATSIVHIPASAMVRQVLHKESTAGLRQMQNATIRYFETHRDENGVVIYPGSNVDMTSVVYPAYGFLPADVRGTLAWETRTSYLFGYPAVYVCVKPTGQTQEGQEVLELIKSTLPVQSSYLGSTCGATSDAVGGTHLTFWMVLAHYNGPVPAPVGVPQASPEPEAVIE